MSQEVSKWLVSGLWPQYTPFMSRLKPIYQPLILSSSDILVQESFLPRPSWSAASVQQPPESVVNTAPMRLANVPHRPPRGKSVMRQQLVGGWTNPSEMGFDILPGLIYEWIEPFEKYWSNWKSSPNRGDNITYLKPPARQWPFLPTDTDCVYLILSHRIHDDPCIYIYIEFQTS